MRIALMILWAGVLLCSGCRCVGDKAKTVLNKAGEAVGEGSTQFVKGVSSGIHNSLNSTLTLSDSLQKQGISFTRFGVDHDSVSSSNNKLIVYLIFAKDFSGKLTVKVLDHNGSEYGRTTLTVAASAGDAKYLDFVFDQRTDIESNSRILVE